MQQFITFSLHQWHWVLLLEECSILVDLGFSVKNTPAYSLDASAMKKRVSKRLAACNNLLLNFIDDFGAYWAWDFGLANLFQPNLIYLSKASLSIVICFVKLELARKKHYSVFVRTIYDEEKKVSKQLTSCNNLLPFP